MIDFSFDIDWNKITLTCKECGESNLGNFPKCSKCDKSLGEERDAYETYWYACLSQLADAYEAQLMKRIEQHKETPPLFEIKKKWWQFWK